MAGRRAERVLWALIYAVLALAPVAFLAAAPETEDSDDVFLGVAIGFVAITTLALQFVIASRGPAFTAAFGIDRLIRLHRAGGIVVLGLVAAHVVTVVSSEDDYGEWLHPLDAPLAGRLGQAAVLLGRRDGIDAVLIPSQPAGGWTGPSGRVSRDLLDEPLPADRRRWSYFVCGPTGMTDTAAQALRELGIPRGRIRVERFAPA